MRYPAPAIAPDGSTERDALIAVQKRTGGLTHAALGPLPSYAKASLPDAATYVDCLIIVTDETGGRVPAFSDGSDWRRVTDRAVVS